MATPGEHPSRLLNTTRRCQPGIDEHPAAAAIDCGSYGIPADLNRLEWPSARSQTYACAYGRGATSRQIQPRERPLSMRRQPSGFNGNDVICGGTGNNGLRGGHGDDRLFGEKGHDLLLGGTGADYLVGGPGRGVLRGGPGKDKCADRAMPR
jgi:hypothetical protein